MFSEGVNEGGGAITKEFVNDLTNIMISVRYGLMPMPLFPKLTEEDKGYLYLSLLVAGRAASAGSDRIRSLYSAGRAYNLVYIITQ